MEPLASPIHIPIIRSRNLSVAVYAGHAIVASAVAFGFSVSAFQLLALSGLFVSFLLNYANQSKLERHACALLLRSSNEWEIITPAGACVRATRVSGLFVSAGLVVFRLRISNGVKLHVVLTADNTPSDAFRRLRVRLQMPM
ncbi:MAG: hypothetical protein O3C28_03945 [Proteobacteria bacterium]|nr:hypothetical protein [Pseudomonadota bacterium]